MLPLLQESPAFLIVTTVHRIQHTVQAHLQGNIAIYEIVRVE